MVFSAKSCGALGCRHGKTGRRHRMNFHFFWLDVSMNAMSQVIANRKQATGAMPLLALGLFFTSVLGHGATLAAKGDDRASSPLVYVGKLDGSVQPGRPFSPDGRLLAVCTKESVTMVDAHTLKPFAETQCGFITSSGDVQGAGYVDESK